jgi:hypothetical protein
MAGFRHGDSSEGFSNDVVKALIDTADNTTVWILGVGDDPKFMGRLIRTMLYTAVHVSNFCGRKEQERWGWKDGAHDKRIRMPAVEALSSRNITETTEEGKVVRMLVYRRVKKRTSNVTHVPIAACLWPWLPAFLDQPKPHSRARYNQLLHDLEVDVYNQKGIRVHINPHRLRHTCMRLLHDEFGLPMADVSRITATTEGTLNKYARRTPGEIGKALAEKGW